MPHIVDIQVFPIAHTALDWEAVQHWLEAIGVKDVHAVFESVSGASDAEALIALAGKRCYQSFQVGLNPNVTKIRDELVPYVANILKSGHGSVLEHATFTYAIEGVTRVFCPEMNRHRAGVAVSEGSLRYIRLTDIAYWLPTSVILTSEEKELLRRIDEMRFRGGETEVVSYDDAVASLGDAEFTAAERIKVKTSTQEILAHAFAADERAYVDLCDLWKIDELSNFHQKKQLTSMFRRVVGMGMSTGGLWTLNVRALRHIIAMRTAEGAEEEIRLVFDKIADHMVTVLPCALADFTRSAQGVWTPAHPKV